jgi:predicted protein tyrosine phosphatase
VARVPPDSRSMNILVCPLSRVADMVALHAPARVISMLNPGSVFPELGDRYVDRHLCLRFHDITIPAAGYIAPEPEHIADLLRFLEEGNSRDSLLIHCHAGISRSTAAAFIAACYASPDADEHALALALLRAAPLARPNGRMVALADEQLGRAGRMHTALENALRDLPWIEVEENEPFRMPLAAETQPD